MTESPCKPIKLDTICVELIGHCSLRCWHCSVSASPMRSEYLGSSLLIRRLQEVGHLSALYLSGGEPTSHPDLLQIAKASRNLAAEVVIYGSGACINQQELDSYPPAIILGLVTAGVDRIDLSLYSGDPTDHDSITQTRGSWHATVTTWKTCIALGMDVGVHFVPLLQGTKHYCGVRDLALKFGASRLHVLAMAVQGRAITIGRIPLGLDVVEVLARDYKSPSIPTILSTGIRNELGIFETTTRDFMHSWVIGVDGKVYPGEGSRTPEYGSNRRIQDAGLMEIIREMQS